MPEVELSVKDYRRLLSLLSEFFGKKKMKPQDIKLKNKIEVMLEAAIEEEKQIDEILGDNDDD